MTVNTSAATPTRLLIVQPYIPAYRVPLFREMRKLLTEHGIEMSIAAGAPAGAQVSRGDDETPAHSDFLLDEKRIKFAGRQLLYRNLSNAMKSCEPDLVVVEQAIKNVENWSLTIRPRQARHPRVAMWGQGRSYSTQQSALEVRAKRWLTRRVDWFFAYTQSGADYVVETGFPPGRVTVLNNSTDTTALKRDLLRVTADEVSFYQAKHGLTPGRTALFIGGVDERKGIRFLIEAAVLVARELPGFKLLIAGSGDLAAMVAREQANGAPIAYLSRVEGETKALAMAASDIMMVPEWVGLVAVDAIAAGLPLVTTHHYSHSPEIEYLRHGSTALFTEHDVASYASGVCAALTQRAKLFDFQESAVGGYLSTEAMAARFTEGIMMWLHSAAELEQDA